MDRFARIAGSQMAAAERFVAFCHTDLLKQASRGADQTNEIPNPTQE